MAGWNTILLLFWILLGFSPVRWARAMTDETPEFCPKVCECQSPDPIPKVDCSSRNLTGLPFDLSNLTTHLDLSMNNISHLPDFAFSHLPNLQELRLMGNSIRALPPNAFKGLSHLDSLDLQGNRLTAVPVDALKGLVSLKQLHLDANQITKVPADSFTDLHSLRQLWLDANNLSTVPVDALNNVPSLEALTLAMNDIRTVPDYSFVNMSKLAVLLLDYNTITNIGDHAFDGLRMLKILDINKNHLKQIPVALSSLPALTELSMSENKIEYLPDNSFSGNKQLTILRLKKNPIMSVGKYAFSNLPRLENLVLSEVRDQEEFPDLTGTHHLEMLSLDRGNIKTIPSDICSKLHKLKSFDIHSNSISQVPDMSECKELRTMNLGNNELVTLSGQPFRGLSQLRDLTLSHNHIENVPSDAFSGLTNLQYLDLQHNKITNIDPDTFIPLKNLEDLNLGHNLFSVLPRRGLENLKNLKTFGNKDLKDFPPPDTFPRIQLLALSYAYHCCEFITDEEKEHNKPELKEDITWLSRDSDNALWNNLTNIWGPLENLSANYPIFADDIWNTFGTDYSADYPEHIPESAAVYFEDYRPKYDAEDIYIAHPPVICKPMPANLSTSYQMFAEEMWNEFGLEEDGMTLPDGIPSSAAYYFEMDYKPKSDAEDLQIARPPISCKPMPGPFMPCDDLMGWWSLRCGVWIVFLLAVLGNGCVLFVSIVSRTKMDVPRFLICNLACADFFMGIYLGFLAVVDASTLGEFKKHAIQWQTSPGCQIAGFLGVLSSELSVFTLTVITLERFYAITHAMHLNKRLSLRHAGYIMACGWFLSLFLASLPIFGVSDYRKFAVCLPFEISNRASLGYVCFIMFLNCLAFGIIVSCYTKMYCSIRGSQAWNSNDSRVAKRMALLVFTDFACWAPISFFSLTAAAGLELISLNDAKVFTIFVLPLNSCANPFLYAIFTKQFKKDCAQICKQLEESAMSRSLSRFSNRNLSISWGSSRRPSLLNSFFNGDKRQSRSNSISGASAAQLEAAAGGMINSSTRGTLNSNSSSRKPGDDLQPQIVPTSPVNGGGNLNGIPPFKHKKKCCFYQDSNREEGEAMVANGTASSMRCSCRRNRGILRSAVREGPVGAGSALLSLIRHKKGVDKLGDGADSDQDEGVWVQRDALPVVHRDRLGLFPLVPLGESPGGTRRPHNRHQRSASPGALSGRSKSKSKTPSPTGSKKMMLNCCNGSPRGSNRSPGLEYQLMRPGEESSFDTDGLPTTGGDPSSSDLDQTYLAMPVMNNNHEYVNITEDMISELQRIRDSSASALGDSSSSGAYRARSPAPLVLTPDDIRPEPEGSETKEKPIVVKIDPLASRPKQGCRCSRPQCQDRKVNSHVAINRSLSVDNADICYFSGPGCSLSRELWLSSTDQGFGRYKPNAPTLPAQCKRDNLRKSNSFDYLKSYSRSPRNQSSHSMPTLTRQMSLSTSTDSCPTCSMQRERHLAVGEDREETTGSHSRSLTLGGPDEVPDVTIVGPRPTERDGATDSGQNHHTNGFGSHEPPQDISLTMEPHNLHDSPYNTHVVLSDSVPHVVLQGTRDQGFTTEAQI